MPTRARRNGRTSPSSLTTVPATSPVPTAAARGRSLAGCCAVMNEVDKTAATTEAHAKRRPILIALLAPLEYPVSCAAHFRQPDAPPWRSAVPGVWDRANRRPPVLGRPGRSTSLVTD